MLDFDNSASTYVETELTARRDFAAASNEYDRPLMNRAGLAIRGHAVTPGLLACLPLLASCEPASLDLRGATESAGAPFVDAVYATWEPFLERFGLRLDLTVETRGAIGIGGGRVHARVAPIRTSGATVRTVFGDASPGSALTPTVEPTFYLLGEKTFRSAAVDILNQFATWLSDRVGVAMTPNFVSASYPANLVHQMYLVSDGGPKRDVTVAFEEHDLMHGLQINRQAILARLESEISRAKLVSRFVAEQVLPLIAMRGEDVCLLTEAVTPHLVTVANLLEQIAGVTVGIESRADGVVEISVPAA